MATNDFEESDSQEIEDTGVDAPVASQTIQQSQFASLAASYLRDWNTVLESSSGLHNSVAEAVSGILANAQETGGDIDAQINETLAGVNQTILDFQQTYGGLEIETMETAMAELGASKDTVAQTHDKAQPAYAPHGQSGQRVRSVDDAEVDGNRSAQQGFGSKHRLAPLTRPTRPASLLKSLRPNGLSCLIRPPKARP